LDLCGLTTLDADTAKALAEFKGTLVLSGLTTLDADTAKALEEFMGEALVLDGLTSLESAALAIKIEILEQGNSFDKLQTLSAEAAEVFAEHKDDQLFLDGLTTLDADTAKALAKFKGGLLSLNGLTTLDFDTAEALAEFQGDVSLDINVVWRFIDKHPFSKDTALIHADLLGGQLDHVTALESPDSVAIAKALASRKGYVALPNLRKITPKTLTALIEKQDVEIPLIETLELIPDPDGGPSDDFTIPEWLEERQKQQRGGR
jgi:hypothetical protein